MTLLLLAAMVVSFGLTWALRRYAMARRLVDVPGERSSHTVVTPRGGGGAIVIAFLAGMFALWQLGYVALPQHVALSGAGLWVALIGFLDDHGHVPAGWRLLGHFLGAAWGLFWLGGMPPIMVGEALLGPPWLVNAIGLVCLVWLLNLYNFMDGIDALAGIEAVSVCAGGIVLYASVLPGTSQWMAPAVLLASVLGFLWWNYPPAKIFLGDAGSGFLGVILGLLTVQAGRDVPHLFWAWAVLLGVFVVDATVTLLRRLLGGMQILQAHRSHAYQHAARRFGAHRPVSLGVGAINCVWLLPIALSVATGRLGGVAGLLLAYAPLICLALYFGAGRKG